MLKNYTRVQTSMKPCGFDSVCLDTQLKAE